MLMYIQNLVKFCPLVLKILSGNQILRSIKGRNSVENLRNLTLHNPNLMFIQNLVKFCPLVLTILSGNENYDGMTELRNYRRPDRANPV